MSVGCEKKLESQKDVNSRFMIGTVYAGIAVLIPSTYPLIGAGMIYTQYIKCHKINYLQELISDIC
jgi:hypothetical protein